MQQIKDSLCLLQFEQQLREKPTSITNQELIEEFLTWKLTHSPVAAKAYRLWVTRFQEFVHKPPEHLRLEDWVAFSDSVRKSEKFAPKNIQFAHNILHNYLRYFFEQGRLGFPLFFVRVPRARAESHYCVTEDEYRKLDQAFLGEDPRSLRNRVIIRMLHDTGVRVGELITLGVADVSTNGEAVIETEKTTGERRIFWTSKTDELLRSYLKVRLRQDTESEALFAGLGRSGRISQRTIQRLIKEACRRAGVTDRVCAHSFRHAFIHRMAREGTPDAIIARMVGHSTPHTVAQYTQLSRPEMEFYHRKCTLEPSNELKQIAAGSFAMAA